MPEYRLFTVDAFTNVAFRGNPASVCFLEHDLPDSTMQAIAAEMNHSERSHLTGKNEMRAYQASPRGGEMIVRLAGDRVDLVGDAIVLTAGALRLDHDVA